MTEQAVVIAPERARMAIAEAHGELIAASVMRIIDGLDLSVQRRQPGDKRWATTARRLRTDERFRQRHADIKRHDKERAQHTTAPTAGRRGMPWTGPELEIAARADLTAEEVASMTGRTYYGVAEQRRKLGVDPRKQRLAGTGDRDG